MQGKKTYQEQMFPTHHQLSEIVPKENFYRRLKEELNLEFLRPLTKEYYGTEGQKSIDPVVFFKLVLMGYLENLNSDRRIIEHASMRMDIKYFINYDAFESIPWHSTLSRTRALYGEEVFKELFNKVLSLCVSKGMVGGKRQAIDSAYIKANASMDSLLEKEVLADGKTFAEELIANEEGAHTVTAAKKKQVEQHHNWKAKEYKGQPQGRRKASEDTFENEKQEEEKKITGKFLSNHTHYSPTDPDARISTKPGKPRQLNYSAQTSVDTKHHVITNIMADFSDKRDSQSLAAAVEQTKENLENNNLKLEEVLADTGYSSGEALRYLSENNITGYIPNFGQYKQSREGFTYNKEADEYICSQGKKLTYKTTRNQKGYLQKEYRSSRKDCKDCPLRSACIGTSNEKKITDSIDKPYYDEMHERLQTRKAKFMKKLRSSTVEPVLGTLINFTAMRRIWTRGIKNANKFMLGAAIAYNIKKWMKYKVRKVNVQVAELYIPKKGGNKTALNLFFCFITRVIFTGTCHRQEINFS
jgi:transposase